MQVAIITIGTRGDIQPYIALGQGLQAAGYEVKVVTFQAFESFVRGSGLDFAAVSGDLASLMTMDWTQSQIESGGKSMGSLGSIAQDADPLSQTSTFGHSVSRSLALEQSPSSTRNSRLSRRFKP
jgi:sterol 3beta-glucosyltransferase